MLIENKKPLCYVMKDGKAPTKSTEGSAGWDVYSSKQITIASNSVKPIPVGIKVACEEDEYFRIADRGGHATKHSMHVVGGVIDSDHRGEVKVAIHNTGDHPIIIGVGLKVAQMVLTRINPAKFKFVEDENLLGETGRGSKGGIHEK